LVTRADLLGLNQGGIVMADYKKSGGVKTAGVLIGVGMGGFVDGITLHQIFQWHNMVSNWIPPTTMETMSVNMLWDGIFHAFVWTVTLVGILMLWRAAYYGASIPPLRPFIGQLVLGWGLFNLVEGIIDHQILGVHYVRQVPNYTIYNLTFLAVGGVIFIAIGWILSKRGTPSAGAARRR
jgi:uncharacterized membrane protein